MAFEPPPALFKNWSEILFNQALLAEGNAVPNPVRFSKLIADLMIQSNKH